jgi:hypothetical protein
MALSPNYGFPEPDNASLVKNGAQDIRALGDSIDSFLFRPFGVNPVINSAFQVWQRGTSFTQTGTGYQYTADRFLVYRSTGNLTASRQNTSDTTNLPNIQYCMRIQRPSGNTDLGNLRIYQDFESVNSKPFAGQTITVSFYARKGANFSATSNTLTLEVYSGTGTDQIRINGFTGNVSVISQGNTLTDTWQRFTATATVPSDSNQLSIALFYTATGTAGAADYFEVTGYQLETGSVATPFKTYAATIQGELSACQRYYFRTGAGVSASSSGARVYPLGVALSTTQMVVSIPFTQTMRVNPTAVSYNNIRAYDSGGFITVTSFTFGDASTSYANIALNAASGFTANRPTFPAQDGVAGYIAFSAEL